MVPRYRRRRRGVATAAVAAAALVGAAQGGTVTPPQSVLSPVTLADWIPAKPDFLPSVPCVQIVALQNSTTLPGLTVELAAMGFTPRVQELVGAPDPQGKAAGDFHAHVKVWNMALDRGCSSALILEEDARFEGSVLQQGFKAIDSFISGGGLKTIDVLLLGWNANYYTGGNVPFQNKTRLSATTTECIYAIQKWFETHAYVISGAAMQRLANASYDGRPIDDYLSDEVPAVVVKPKMAFQGLHASQAVSQDARATQTDGPGEVIAETPAIW